MAAEVTMTHLDCDRSATNGARGCWRRPTCMPPPLVMSVVVLVLSLGLVSTAFAQKRIWQMRPYRIKVVVAADWSPDWNENVLSRIKESIKEQADLHIGRPWQLTVVDGDEALRHTLFAAGNPLDVIRRTPPVVGDDVDKVIVLGLCGDGSAGSFVVAREFDHSLRGWGPVHQRWVSGTADLYRESFRAVTSAFTAIAQVRSVSEGRVTIVPRASFLPTRHSALAPFQDGAVVQLVDRRRSAVAGSTSPIEWTYVVVDRVGDVESEGRIVSRFESPIDAVPVSSLVAVHIRSVPGPQAIRIIDEGSGDGAAGMELLTGPAAGPFQSLARTDAAGTAVVELRESLVWLEIRSDGEPLDRRPWLPGGQTQTTIPLPLDNATREAARRLSQFRAQVAELARRREIGLARADARVAAGRSAEAVILLEVLRETLDTDGARLTTELAAHRQAGRAAKLGLPARWNALDAELKQVTNPAAINQTSARAKQ